MRLLHLYLIAYGIVLIVAGVVLWRGGLLAQIPAGWLVIAVLIAVGFGVMLALASTPGAAHVSRTP